MYKLLTIIYKSVIFWKGYNSPYKQGPTTPSTHYKYQVPLYSLDTLYAYEHTPAHICITFSFILS